MDSTIFIQLSKLIGVLSGISNATLFMMGILAMCAWLFYKADRDPTNPVRWVDLIIDPSTNRASPYKIGYLIGAMVGTWVIITLADVGRLQVDMFGVYLAFMLGGAGWQMTANNRQPYNSPYNSPSNGNVPPYRHTAINGQLGGQQPPQMSTPPVPADAYADLPDNIRPPR